MTPSVPVHKLGFNEQMQNVKNCKTCMHARRCFDLSLEVCYELLQHHFHLHQAELPQVHTLVQAASDCYDTSLSRMNSNALCIHIGISKRHMHAALTLCRRNSGHERNRSGSMPLSKRSNLPRWAGGMQYLHHACGLDPVGLVMHSFRVPHSHD